MNIKKQYYIGEGFYRDENGCLLLAVKDEFIKFNQTSDASDYFKKETLSLVKATKKVFENEITKPVEQVTEILFLLDVFEEKLKGSESLNNKTTKNKRLFFSILEKIEILRVFNYGNSKKTEIKLTEVRDMLIKNFIQVQKLSKIIEVNRDVFATLKSNIENSEDELHSFLNGSEFGFFGFIKAKERLIECKTELKKVYLVKPEKELFEDSFSVLMDGTVTDIMNADLLYEKIKQLKSLFNNPPK